ncbi:MAG: class II aldolase/adducin family protein [Phototrophicaceae bacterium]
MQQEQALREQICLVGEQLHRFRLVDGTAGNISARLDGERVLVTPSGVCKGFMKPEQLIVLDLEGRRLDDGPAQFTPTSETPMHLEVYRQRPDVGGVVHAHPGYAVALTMAGINFQRYIIPEAVILLGEVPTAPYATPATHEDADAVRELIRDHDAMLLSHHGSLTVGDDPWHAYMRLETLEHTARLIYYAHQIGGVTPLPDGKLHKLHDLRRSLGMNVPEDTV